MRHYFHKPRNRMDKTELFDVSDRLPRLTSSGEDISPITVENKSTRIITKGVGTRYPMCQECVFEV